MADASIPPRGADKAFGPGSWASWPAPLQGLANQFYAGCKYAENHPPLVTGAQYSPPEGRVIVGRGNYWPEEDALQAALGADLLPASRLSFVDLNNTPPLAGAALFKGVVTHLSLSLFKIEGVGLDQAVIAGVHDQRLISIAQQVKAHGDPVMVRIGFEFNGSWNGYHSAYYADAFRHVVALFRDEGVTNAAFVWSYYPSGPDIDFKLWDPGDGYREWGSLDVYGKGDFTEGGANYKRSIAYLDYCKSAGITVFLSETGSVDVPMAQQKWSDWFAPFFAFIEGHPEIQGFHFCSKDWGPTQWGKPPNNWKDGNLVHNPALVALYAAELRKARYLHANEIGLLAP